MISLGRSQITRKFILKRNKGFYLYILTGDKSYGKEISKNRRKQHPWRINYEESQILLTFTSSNNHTISEKPKDPNQEKPGNPNLRKAN